MKNVAPIRRELGVKTFFNMLGPLVNPAFPQHQLTGVFNLKLARLYGYLFQKTDQNFTILYALDGYDEISLTCPTKAIRNSGESLIRPQDFGLMHWMKNKLLVGIRFPLPRPFLKMYYGKGSQAQNDVVCRQCGRGHCYCNRLSPLEGFEKAKESLLSENAEKALKLFKNSVQHDHTGSHNN